MGRPYGLQADNLAGALALYTKAEAALRQALAREIKEAAADSALVRRAVAIVTR
jgi:hypothetical protein